MNLFSFNGRRRRRDYWLISIGVGIVLTIAEALAESNPFLYLLICIPGCWVSFANGAQRCHDLGHNGWWQLIPFYSLWMAFQNSEPGNNEYGENPKGDVCNASDCDGGKAI